MANLSVAGNRLLGFCRTNLFKRPESSGHCFLLSVERHILRNFIYLHAVENNLPLPIGTQDAGLLDTRANDSDENELFGGEGPAGVPLRSEQAFRERAAGGYKIYVESHRTRFGWIRPAFFRKELGQGLLRDSRALRQIFSKCSSWDPQKDTKLKALIKLVAEKHRNDKVLIFSQFGDTVDFLAQQLKNASVKGLSAVTGDSPDVTNLAWAIQSSQ